jgi:hypothetical protein
MNNRRATINELLNQFSNQSQTSENRQMVPVNERNEYQIMDEDSIRDDELSQYTDDGIEIDLNSRRNRAKPHTFWL